MNALTHTAFHDEAGRWSAFVLALCLVFWMQVALWNPNVWVELKMILVYVTFDTLKDFIKTYKNNL